MVQKRQSSRTPRPKKKKRKKTRFWSSLARFCVVFGIWASVAVFVYVGYCALDLPDIHQVTQPPLRPSVEMEAEDGTVFARYGDLIGDYVVPATLPPHVSQAIISIEDRRFYNHFGIDVFGILRAAVRNTLARRTVQGGSTLTQQLAKNLFLSPKRAMKRKVQEMLLALWLERTYTKDQILTAYLNRVYLGSGAYGVDAAAQTYFNKSARELTLHEASLIAGLLRAPSRYSPLHDPKQAMERSKLVLQAMVEEGYITEAERRVAVASSPKLERRQTGGNDGRYFADWIYDQLGPLIADTQQDMIVKTTLDMSLERLAEQHVEAILAKHGTERKVSEAALITVGPDGSVRALTGGRNYRRSQFNRATQALRQPGSAFKPIVYLAALEQGLAPDETIEDEPIKIGRYAPTNYDGRYLGTVSVRYALAESINTVAVRILDRYGVDSVMQTARDLGISSRLDRNAALALGVSEVTPLEMAAVYASLASGGKAITPYGIKQIRNRNGKILYQHESVAPPQVVDEASVSLLNDMLQDVLGYGTGKAAKLGSRPAAGKTGTTSDYRDAWFAGFTADYTTVIWMGNDDNSPTRKVTGGSLPAMLWRAYMTDAERNFPERSLRTAGFAEQIFDRAGAAANDVSDAFGAFIDNILGTRR